MGGGGGGGGGGSLGTRLDNTNVLACAWVKLMQKGNRSQRSGKLGYVRADTLGLAPDESA